MTTPVNKRAAVFGPPPLLSGLEAIQDLPGVDHVILLLDQPDRLPCFPVVDGGEFGAGGGQFGDSMKKEHGVMNAYVNKSYRL